MLEMDLAAQSGAIWEDEQEDPRWEQTVENNRKFYQELEAQGKTLMSAEPEVPEEVIQEALRQQEKGREDKGHIRPLQTGGREGTEQNVPQGDGSRSEREGKTAITGLERLTIIDKVAHLSKTR